MHLDEHGQVYGVQLQGVGGSQCSHDAGRSLGIVIVGDVDDLVVIDARALSDMAGALEEGTANGKVPVEPAQFEGYVQLCVGGVGPFAGNLEVVAPEHGVGLQAAVFARITDVCFKLVCSMFFVMEVAVVIVCSAHPVVGNPDIEALAFVAQ